MSFSPRWLKCAKLFSTENRFNSLRPTCRDLAMQQKRCVSKKFFSFNNTFNVTKYLSNINAAIFQIKIAITEAIVSITRGRLDSRVQRIKLTSLAITSTAAAFLPESFAVLFDRCLIVKSVHTIVIIITQEKHTSSCCTISRIIPAFLFFFPSRTTALLRVLLNTFIERDARGVRGVISRTDFRK